MAPVVLWRALCTAVASASSFPDTELPTVSTDVTSASIVLLLRGSCAAVESGCCLPLLAPLAACSAQLHAVSWQPDAAAGCRRRCPFACPLQLGGGTTDFSENSVCVCGVCVRWGVTSRDRTTSARMLQSAREQRFCVFHVMTGRRRTTQAVGTSHCVTPVSLFHCAAGAKARVRSRRKRGQVRAQRRT